MSKEAIDEVIEEWEMPFVWALAGAYFARPVGTGPSAGPRNITPAGALAWAAKTYLATRHGLREPYTSAGVTITLVEDGSLRVQAPAT